MARWVRRKKGEVLGQYFDPFEALSKEIREDGGDIIVRHGSKTRGPSTVHVNQKMVYRAES